MEPIVRVVSADEALRRALVSRLTPVIDIKMDTESSLSPERALRASDILVIPAAELSPPGCQDLVDEGFHVIVLAAVPRPVDEQSYRAAGAADYIPMTIDPAPLVDAICRAARLATT